MVDVTSRYRYFPRLAAGSSKAATIAKLRAYGQSNIPAGARRSMEEAIASIGQRMALRTRMKPQVLAWLKTQGY